MVVMIHDKGINKFYLTTCGMLMLKGLEHGDLDGLAFVKGMLKSLTPIDLKESLPYLRITKLYQIDSSEITSEIPVDKSADPQPYEIPTEFR